MALNVIHIILVDALQLYNKKLIEIVIILYDVFPSKSSCRHIKPSRNGMIIKYGTVKSFWSLTRRT